MNGDITQCVESSLRWPNHWLGQGRWQPRWRAARDVTYLTTRKAVRWPLHFGLTHLRSLKTKPTVCYVYRCLRWTTILDDKISWQDELLMCFSLSIDKPCIVSLTFLYVHICEHCIVVWKKLSLFIRTCSIKPANIFSVGFIMHCKFPLSTDIVDETENLIIAFMMQFILRVLAKYVSSRRIRDARTKLDFKRKSTANGDVAQKFAR